MRLPPGPPSILVLAVALGCAPGPGPATSPREGAPVPPAPAACASVSSASARGSEGAGPVALLAPLVRPEDGPSPAGEAVSVAPGLSRAAIQGVMRANLTAFKRCYESSLATRPDAQGRLVLRFVIGGAGRVVRAEITDSTLDDATLERCLVAAVGRLEFPEPEHGVDVTVSYPFVFKPAE